MRVASLLPSATEIVALLGRENDLVAISHECDFPASVTHLPRATCSLIDSQQSSEAIDRQVRARLAAGQTLYDIDAEVLVTSRPDLVLTQSQCDVCAVRPEQVERVLQRQAALSHTDMLTLAPATLAETLEDIGRVGLALDAEGAATQAIERLRQRIDNVRQQGEHQARGRPRVACLEWTEPMMAAGNWNPGLFALAGAQYGMAEEGKHSPEIDWEALARFDPEVVIVAPCGFDLPRSRDEAERWRRDPRATDLAACRHDQVFAIDGNALLNRSGPRLVETLETIAALLHPEAFSAPSDDAWVRVPAS
jgi:iron complex transport system substrate-binding protein